jgi:MFS family permease
VPGRLYRRPFVCLWFSVFLFYLSFQLLLPLIPVYAIGLGLSEAHVGLLHGFFAFSAMLWRPLAGHWADSIGRRPFVVLGPAVFALSSLGYSAAAGAWSLLALRFFHGIGMGFGPTAGSVVVADVSPAERRGEAMGVFGLTTTTGLIIGPYMGIEISERWGIHAAFLASAAVAIVALLLTLWCPRRARRCAAPDSCPFQLCSAGGLCPRRCCSRSSSPTAASSPSYLSSPSASASAIGVFFTVFALAVLVATPRRVAVRPFRPPSCWCRRW